MTAVPIMAIGVIDVSSRAAELLEFKGNGVARVRVEYVGRAPLEGSDDRQLMATLRTGVPAPSPSLVRVASARPFVPEYRRPGAPDPRRGSDAGRAALQPRQHPAGPGLDRRRPGMSASARSRSSGRVPRKSARRVLRGCMTATSDVSPVSAYAPIDPHGPSELLAGRGLY